MIEFDIVFFFDMMIEANGMTGCDGIIEFHGMEVARGAVLALERVSQGAY